MQSLSILQAQQQLPELLIRAVAGEEIVIEAMGKPLARLVPCTAADPKPARRPLGLANGRYAVPANFDRLYEDEINMLFSVSPAQ